MGPSMAVDHNLKPKFVGDMLYQCYTIPDILVQYNKIKFNNNEEETKQHIQFLCGKLVTNAKSSGIDLIIINTHESKNTEIHF